jgi:hypothetical protein
MESKVKVKSLISSRILLTAPEIRLRREWEKKGAVKLIPFEQLEEAMYNPGVEALFREGALGIDDMEVKIALGLEEEGTTKPTNIIALDDAQRKRYLENMPVPEFRQEVKKLPYEQLIELANYAIENEIANYDKSEILLGLTDIDILSAIKNNRDDREVPKEDK